MHEQYLIGKEYDTDTNDESVVHRITDDDDIDEGSDLQINSCMHTVKWQCSACILLGHNSDDSNDDVDCHLEELLYNEDNGNIMNILHYEQHT